MNEVLKEDNKLKYILEKLGLERGVNYIDRANYNIWKDSWNISDELLEHALTLAHGKDNPMKYLSKVLSDWHEKGISTVDDAKKTSPLNGGSVAKQNFSGRSYSREELNALFQTIDEIDV